MHRMIMRIYDDFVLIFICKYTQFKMISAVLDV